MMRRLFSLALLSIPRVMDNYTFSPYNDSIMR